MEGAPADGKKPPDLDGSVFAETQGAIIAEIDIDSETLGFFERPLIYNANKITAAQRYQRNVARSLYNAGAATLYANPGEGVSTFLLIAYDTHLTGEGNEWQEALAMQYGDDCVGFLAGASMEPATYQKEQVMMGRVALRLSRFDGTLDRKHKLDIRTNTTGNSMHTNPWHYKLVATNAENRGADPFPVGGLPAAFGFEAADMADWQQCQRTALINQVAHLLTGPDGLWPTLDVDAAKLRFTVQRKKHVSQQWYWQIGVIAQEHKQIINDWLWLDRQT